MQIATVRGRRISFADTGARASGRTLLLVHAFPMGAGLFEPQQGAFPGWRVIVPALPGFDGSDLLEQPAADDYARHLIGLLDVLGIDRAVVGGVSLGGYLTFGILRHAPERVDGVILADTRSAADSADARAGRERMLQIVQESGPPGVADDMLPKLFGPTSRRTRHDRMSQVRAMIEAQTREGIAAAVRVLMSRPDSTPMLAGLRMPALVIVGTEDTLTPPSEMRAMASALPQAQYVEIDGAGHIANFEDPAAFNRHVREFLYRVP